MQLYIEDINIDYSTGFIPAVDKRSTETCRLPYCKAEFNVDKFDIGLGEKRLLPDFSKPEKRGGNE